MGGLEYLFTLSFVRKSSFPNKRTVQILVPLMKLIPFLLALFSLLCSPLIGADRTNVNIVWIVIEDASPHVGCYGETLIKTPNIDRMAREGIRCKNAFVTSPVCSSSRSAMVSGMYQTTLGVHNHRSQTSSGKGGQCGLLRQLQGAQVGQADPRALSRRRILRHQQEQDRLQLHPDEQALSRQRLEEGACRPTHLRPIPTQWRKEPQSEKPCRSR